MADPRGRALVLQGSDSQQWSLLGRPLSMFLQLAGMTCTYVCSLLFSPEDNYNWHARVEGSSFFSPLIC